MDEGLEPTHLCDPLSHAHAPDPNASRFLKGDGELATLIREFDWASTALGPIARWPQSLKTATGFIVQSAVPMVMLWGVDGYMIYNDPYSVFAGGRHPKLLGSKVREGWPEVADFNDNVMRVGLGGGTLAYRDQELTLHRTGAPEQVWMNLDYSPVLGEDGEPAGVIAIVVETTERVLADRRASAEQERQRQLFARMPGFVAVLTGPGHVYDYANKAYEKLANGRPLLGLSVREAFPELEGQGFYELLDRVYATGERHLGSRTPITLAGEAEERFIDFLYEAIRDETGAITGIFVGGYDVTEAHRDAQALRKTEAELRELNASLEQRVAERTAELKASEARMRTIFETGYQYQGLITPEGTIIDANAISLRGIQKSLEEVVGKPFWEAGWFAGTPGASDLVRQAISQVAQGETLRREFHVNLPEGGWRWFDLSLRPIRDEDGKVVAIVPEAVEFTERRAAEDALLQSQKLEAMGQLTGGVAHDFNNLLTPIVGSLDMLMRRGLNDDRERRLIEGAMQAAERAKVLVQRLLAFSRRQPLQTSAVDIADLVAGMADLVASTTGPQIRVVVDIADALPPAVADPNQLELAILNLSVNARDAMEAGGVLRISARHEQVGADHPTRLEPGDYVRLSVADTGAGMDEATRLRAIEPFFSTKGVKGTGLGLSMVHGLASQLGGVLTLTSTKAVGTNVELWLPADAAPPRPGDRKEAASVRGGDHIGVALLVDDEDLARASTAHMLLDLGYDVVEAASGEEALRLIDQGQPADVLVTDHLMPGLSGADLAREVQARRPGAAVVIVSGFAELEEVAPDLPRLAKPFRQTELASMLATVAAKHR